ncbi:MAG TPA: redoxin family protein [Cellvibrionaceae bacterium]
MCFLIRTQHLRLLWLLMIHVLLRSFNCAAEPTKGGGTDFFALTLKSLQQPKAVSLAEYKNKNIILSFFEPDCPWCYQQIMTLKKLQARCADNTQIILIGVHATRQQLQQELRRVKTNLPAFEVNQTLLEITGPIAATPLTYFFNGAGIPSQVIRGYAPYHPAFEAACKTSLATTER